MTKKKNNSLIQIILGLIGAVIALFVVKKATAVKPKKKTRSKKK